MVNMEKQPAGRQRRFIFLYVFIAVPVAIVLLYFFNPTVQSKTNGYLQGVTGSYGAEQSSTNDLEDAVIPTAAQDEVQVDSTLTPVPPPEVQKSTVETPITTSSQRTITSQAFHTQSETSSGASRSPFPTSLKSLPSSTAGAEPPKPSDFNDDKWWFQADLDPEVFRLPNIDVDKLQYLAPHNYRGLVAPTYATYFATRNATLQDPFFISALQIVYRLLWDPKIKSEKYPITVFVAPFVPEEMRRYFAAAGALVRELSLIPYTPKQVTFGRWRDMFSKLEMWRQLDFSRIAYMDSDAFPVNNTDAIFDVAVEQKCNPYLLPEEDQLYASTICDYVLSGCPEGAGALFQGMNAGVMVFKPNRAMYTRLLREIYNEHPGVDTTYMEQGYLNYMYRKEGPFPYQAIPKAWNAPQDFHTKGKENYIVHDKMWSHIFDSEKDLWVIDDYRSKWEDMLALYESEDFVRIRNEDQEKMMADLG